MASSGNAWSSHDTFSWTPQLVTSQPLCLAYCFLSRKFFFFQDLTASAELSGSAECHSSLSLCGHFSAHLALAVDALGVPSIQSLLYVLLSPTS